MIACLIQHIPGADGVGQDRPDRVSRVLKGMRIAGRVDHIVDPLRKRRKRIIDIGGHKFESRIVDIPTESCSRFRGVPSQSDDMDIGMTGLMPAEQKVDQITADHPRGARDQDGLTGQP